MDIIKKIIIKSAQIVAKSGASSETGDIESEQNILRSDKVGQIRKILHKLHQNATPEDARMLLTITKELLSDMWKSTRGYSILSWAWNKIGI